MTTGIFRNEIRTIRCTCGTRHRTWSAIGKCALRKIARYPLHHTLRGQDGPLRAAGLQGPAGPQPTRPCHPVLAVAHLRRRRRGRPKNRRLIVRLARGDDR
jgi:hypothetical protein